MYRKGEKPKKELDKNLIILICVIAAVLIIGVVCVVLVLGRKKSTPPVIDNQTAEQTKEDTPIDIQQALDDAAGIYDKDTLNAMGGNPETLNELNFYLFKFTQAIGRESYEEAYQLYATELLEAAGYKYTLDMFKRDMAQIRASICTPEAEGLWAGSLWYRQTEHYIILHGYWREDFGDTFGEMYEKNFTLVKDASGEYKILDFAWNDLDMYDSRLKGNGIDIGIGGFEFY